VVSKHLKTSFIEEKTNWNQKEICYYKYRKRERKEEFRKRYRDLVRKQKERRRYYVRYERWNLQNLKTDQKIRKTIQNIIQKIKW